MFDEKQTYFNPFKVVTGFCYFLTDGKRTFKATVITSSCIVFVLLVIIGVLIWRVRRALPNNRAATTDKPITDRFARPDSPRDQHVSEPGSYMELQPRPSVGQSHAPPEYTSLQSRDKNPVYYNVGFNKGNKRDKQEEIYDEVGNAQC